VGAERRRAVFWYVAAALAAVGGVAVAASRVPGGYDWVYTVISRLGSHRHNPDGAAWLAASMLLATALMWPVTRHLGRSSGPGRPGPRVAVAVLRAGLVGGALLGLEGLLALDLSRIGRKAHEALALGTFLGLYGGVVGLFAHRIRHATSSVWPAAVVLIPLCAVGFSQAALYLDQRELGWVNTAWREMGIPFWMSFAFWQWLAVLFLGLGIGYLVVAGVTPRRRSR
jgi:hypothetical protein